MKDNNEPEAKPEAADKAPVKKSYAGEIFRAIGLLGQLGVSMAACIFVGVIAGKYLDIWFGTSPVFLIMGSIIGGVASFKVLYDIAIKGWGDK